MNSACKGAMLLFAILLLVACQVLPLAPTASTSLSAQPTAGASLTEIDLSGIKAYLLDQSQALKTSTEALKAQSDEYYSIAEEAGFDYTILWQERSTEILDILTAARGDWAKASPLYEKMEGIVAGTPALVEYDVILDAGASAAEDPENAVPFDLTLPDGRVLPQPGNLFGVTESTLWGTEPNYIADVEADWDGDGEIEFGETIPDANVLKAGIDALDSYAGELLT